MGDKVFPCVGGRLILPLEQHRQVRINDSSGARQILSGLDSRLFIAKLVAKLEKQSTNLPK